MASTKDKLQTALSEVRSLILGAQILLGFQYQAVFRPRFADLPPFAKALEVATCILMLVTLLLLIAPSPFHRLAENGEATQRQLAYSTAMIRAVLVPFALAIGANVTMTVEVHLGRALAALLGVATTCAAAWFWFGLGTMQRNRQARPPASQGKEGDETLPLKEKVTELLTESRIVLPGVQALLGFQFAAYLTDTFEKLSATAKAVHTISLLLIALTMILLMSPAPYHRLAENGEHTARFETIGERFILCALVPLAFGLAGDFYVVLDKV